MGIEVIQHRVECLSDDELSTIRTQEFLMSRRQFLHTSALISLAATAGTFTYVNVSYAFWFGLLFRIIARWTIRIGYEAIKAAAICIASKLATETIEAIWDRDKMDNTAEIEIINKTGEYVYLNDFEAILIDSKSGKIEFKRNLGQIAAEPHARHTFILTVRELPYNGIKTVQIDSEKKFGSNRPTSGKILVADL